MPYPDLAELSVYRPTGRLIVCRGCGCDFPQDKCRSLQRYCSVACRDLATKTKRCKQCDGRCENKFCSNTCRRLYEKPPASLSISYTYSV